VSLDVRGDLKFSQKRRIFGEIRGHHSMVDSSVDFDPRNELAGFFCVGFYVVFLLSKLVFSISKNKTKNRRSARKSTS